ncbi:phosphotransferase [Candidatus Poribacteria bacterium]|nr:phosphotransferase [Candidatus Poribacteria bacterium]MYH82972.1 phosphotransferase [Candidatus Poribacteria bacterium]
MAEKMSCPFCQTQVEYAIENSPDWYRDPSLPVYRIDCHDKCRQYWLEAISDPHPQIDPAIVTFLDSLNDEQRTFVSESTRHACDNGILIVYNRNILQYLVTDWHYVKAAVTLYELNNVSFQISGIGFDVANMLFFLDTADARFTLRLHRAGTSIHEIRSKIYWLQALWNEASIRTLSPVPGRDGEMIQCPSPNDLSPRYATVYDWIPGETLHGLPAAEKTPELIRKLGIMVGRMHAVSETLELPNWFTRPRYDTDWITAKIEAALGSDTDTSAEELAKLSSLSLRFSQFVAEHGEERDVFGLIHSDLEPHNIIVSDGQPCPIDVMEFGFGYYLSDILTLSRHFSEDEQTIFFEGYQEIRALPTDYPQQLALFEEIRVL